MDNNKITISMKNSIKLLITSIREDTQMIQTQISMENIVD